MQHIVKKNRTMTVYYVKRPHATDLFPVAVVYAKVPYFAFYNENACISELEGIPCSDSRFETQEYIEILVSAFKPCGRKPDKYLTKSFLNAMHRERAKFPLLSHSHFLHLLMVELSNLPQNSNF